MVKRLSNNELSGSDGMMLTKTQINKIRKAARMGIGVDLKISKSPIRKAIQKGGLLCSALMPMLVSLALCHQSCGPTTYWSIIWFE